MNNRNAVWARIRQANIQHYHNLLQNADQSMAFEALTSLLKVETSLRPDNDSKKNLCHQILNSFEENVMKIRNEIDASKTKMNDIETPTKRIVEHPMTDICPTTTYELQTIIQSHHVWISYLSRCLRALFLLIFKCYSSYQYLF